MKRYILLDLIDEVLSSTSEPLSPMQIWEKAQEMALDKKWKTEGKTPHNTISARLYTLIRDFGETCKYEQTSKRPPKFVIRKQIKETPKISPSHSNLIQSLTSFLATKNELRCHLKSIIENNNWTCPNAVGVAYPILKCKNDDFSFRNFSQVKNVKLISFSIEESLNLQNLREAFFRAFSNSNWADEAFLVCKNFNETEDMETFNDELRKLSDTFKISIITLNEKAELWKYQPSIKPHPDWESIERLCEYSSEFRDFIEEMELETEEVYNKFIV